MDVCISDTLLHTLLLLFILCNYYSRIQVGDCIDFTNISRKLARKFTRLMINHEEYAFLKAMLLLNPGW